MKLEDLKLQIAEELVTKDINNIEEYINELHEILPNYLNKVPNKYSKNFYEFAGKFMKYLFENQDEWENDIIANIGYASKIFINCYNEYYKIDLILNDFETELDDVTNNIIKILQSYCDDTNGIIGDLDEAKQILMDIFNLNEMLSLNGYPFIDSLNCDWDKVSESLTFNDFIPLDDEDDEDDYYEKFKNIYGELSSNPYSLNLDKDIIRLVLIKLYPNIKFSKWKEISDAGKKGMDYSAWSASSDKYIMNCKSDNKNILTICYKISYGPTGESEYAIDFGNKKLISLFKANNGHAKLNDMVKSTALLMDKKLK